MRFLVPDQFATATGVYIIRTASTTKVYVGSTKNLKKRFYNHVSDLNKGIHRATGLQQVVAEHGIDTLRFELLQVCKIKDLNKTEQLFIDSYQSYRPELGFNSSPTAGSCLGIKRSQETKNKLSNRVISPETRARISAAAKGRIITPEQREKISRSTVGIPKSTATKARMSIANKGRIVSAETKAKLANRVVSEETRARISAAAKARIITPEEKARLKVLAQNQKPSAETIAKREATKAARRAEKKLLGERPRLKA